MNDDGNELTEAQCALAAELSARVWDILHAHEPEVVSTAIIDVLAAFLANWGNAGAPPLRRQMQAEVMVHIARVTFDLLDLREIEGR